MYEYRVESDTFDHELVKVINKLGKENWELVSVCYQESGTASNRFVAFLKKAVGGAVKA
jgi:hypothetical protein